MDNMLEKTIQGIGTSPVPPNHTYADLHHVRRDVRKGRNEQVRLVSSDDGNTFNIIRGREGVRVGPDKPHIIGPYSISDFDKEYSHLIEQGFRLSFDKAPQELKVTTEGNYAAIPDKRVDDIIKGLVECSRQAFESLYTVSVKRITEIPKSSIDEARQILKAMDDCKGSTTVKEFNNALMAVYEILPRRIDNLNNLIAKSEEDFEDIITRESQGIDMLEEQIRQALTKQVIVDHKPDICEAYGFTVRPVNAEEKDEIFERLHGVDSGDTFDCRGNYRFGMRIIYHDDNPIQTRYEEYCRAHDIGTEDYDHGQSLLFHGSGTENYWNIMKTGWMIHPDARYCGSAYGHGTYFAPDARKSINYASNSSVWRSADNSVRAFLSMADVATGKIYDVENEGRRIPDNASDLERICPGADCLWAYGGNTFMHDEVVVYRECQSRMKYLLEVE